MDDFHDFVPIQDFPNYGVNIQGEIVNFSRGTFMGQHKSANGHLYVALSIENRLYPRIIARLVADAFLPVPPEDFDTIIHHDYNLENNHASNLSWRPRYFAVQYHRQKLMATLFRIRHPIVCIETGEVFPSSKEAAISYGILEMDLCAKLDDPNGEIFPIGKRFASF
jgi:hypothetical protein